MQENKKTYKTNPKQLINDKKKGAKEDEMIEWT